MAFVAFVYETALIKEAKELTSLHGVLIPADDPMPPSSCTQIPDNALLIYMGFATSWVTQFPHTIIEVDNTPRLVVDRGADKSISISLNILGSDNKIIVELNKNQFTVSPHNYFKMVRKDRSSLTVFDDYNKEVLIVRYLNPKAIWINAELKYPGSQPVVFRGSGGWRNLHRGIRKSRSRLSKINERGSCLDSIPTRRVELTKRSGLQIYLLPEFRWLAPDFIVAWAGAGR
jgi:hypothetical protein